MPQNGLTLYVLLSKVKQAGCIMILVRLNGLGMGQRLRMSDKFKHTLLRYFHRLESPVNSEFR